MKKEELKKGESWRRGYQEGVKEERGRIRKTIKETECCCGGVGEENERCIKKDLISLKEK